MALGLLPGLLRGQNLVPNPDFEQLRSRPCRALRFSPTDSLTVNIGAFIADWTSPTAGTADPWLYDTSLDPTCTQNLYRFRQPAHSGQSCVGVYTTTFGTVVPENSIPYREYVQTRLRQPMRKGAVYRIEFYTLLRPTARAATNNLGVYFSKERINLVETNPLLYGARLRVQPQINASRVLDHNHAWEKVTGCIVAADNYEYLTIGNFYDDRTTERTRVPARLTDSLAFPQNYLLPYYFIDDVSVVEESPPGLPLTSLGPDTTLCPNQRLTLRLPTAPTLSYRWQDGSTAPTYTIGASGEYRLETVVGACVLRDTLRVTVEKAPVLPPDTVLCRGETLVLRPATGTDLVWSSGSRSDGSRSSDSRGPTFTVSEAGTYTVQIPSRTCLLADTLRVEMADCPGPVPNVFTPNGDGRNDTFFVENIDLAPWHLRVFNRWGAPVYEANPYRNEWTGDHQPAGTYYYELTSRVLKRALKGWVQVLR